MPAIRFGKVCELMGKAALIQPSFYEAMKALPDNERLQLYDAICEYSGIFCGGKSHLLDYVFTIKKEKESINDLFVIVQP